MDAGILIRIAYVYGPLSERVLARIEDLDAAGWEMVYAPQAVREALNALTRPVANGGYGLEASTALRALDNVESTFSLLHDGPESFRRWRFLVAKYAIVGKSVHDANVVASALAYGATHILTLNERDFRRYAEVEVVAP